MAHSDAQSLAIETAHWIWLGGAIGLYAGQRFDPVELQQTLPNVKLLACADGQAMIREGEVGDDIYILHKGSALVSRNGKAVGELTPGDFFGEMSFLVQAPRAATITAVKNCQIFCIPSADLERFVGKSPALLAAMRSAAKRRMSKLIGP
ncbi:MAG: cyclic nucleotide-binding domain-containing protein [Elusimicrobia bacterium]|nr:cyclic nucleotide-binding domain-containing protein [Elusimicrobiota bacterium]